jgi:hypothetical protein
MIVTFYNFSDWYWIVSGDASRVWSSARMMFVPASDPDYQAWQQPGKVATRIGSTDELFSVLVQQCFAAAASAGVSVNCVSDASLSGIYSIDPQSLQNISAISTGIAAGKPLPGGGAKFPYPIGSSHNFDGANFLNFASAIEGFVWAYQQAIADRLAGTATPVPSASLSIA